MDGVKLVLGVLGVVSVAGYASQGRGSSYRTADMLPFDAHRRVADYRTGRRLGGFPSHELVQESLKTPTGAVGARQDEEGVWQFVREDDSPQRVVFVEALAGAAQGSRSRVEQIAALEQRMRALFPKGSAAKKPLAGEEGVLPFSPPKPKKAGAKEREQICRDLLSLDVQDVPDYLLVATLLLDVAKSDPVKLAQRYLAETDHNLAKILSGERLSEMGLGDEARARLAAAGELVRRASLRSSMAVRGEPVLDAGDAVRWLRMRAEGPRERLVALYLNNRNKIIMMRTLTEGSHRFTVVDPLQVLRPAVEVTASAIVLAHQHPSGDPTPSTQDHEVTRRVIAAARALQVSILDHIIITPEAYTSMREATSIDFSNPPGISWTA